MSTNLTAESRYALSLPGKQLHLQLDTLLVPNMVNPKTSLTDVPLPAALR